MSLHEFWKIFDAQLEPIDQELAIRGTPIFRRPWAAAFLFLEHCILETKGITKEEIFTNQIFLQMVRRSRRWYVEKYGETSLERDRDEALGMVEFFDTPFELRIPLTVSRPTQQGGITALHFPRVVHRDEDSLDFLSTPPNLGRFGPKGLQTARAKVSRVAGLIRRLNVYAMLADVGRDEGGALSSGIRTSFEKGVTDVCSGDSARLSDAVWEFNFAAEKAIKTFLWQKSKPPPKSHDIPTLISQAIGKGLTAPPSRWVTGFPSGKDAVLYRYGNLGTPFIGGVMELYRIALLLAHHCAREYKATLGMVGKGGVFFLKSPWDGASTREPE